MFTEILMGTSFPIGKFGSKEHSDSSAGFAKTGIGASVSLGYRLSDKVAILLLASGAQNKQDEQPLEERMNKAAYPGTRYEVSTKSWKIGKLMTGAGFTWPLSASGTAISFSKLSAGVCKTAIPENSGVVYGSNNIPSGAFTSAKIALPWAFCYQISTGVELGLAKRINLVTELAYFDGKPVWKTNKWANYPNFPQFFAPYEVKYSLASINLMAGVKVNL